jgi:short-subunit dehydrogenase
MFKKMNILILGASSSIGQAIIKQLSFDNNLFLLTSNKEKIKKNINSSFLDKSKIKIIEADLSNKINPEIVINYNINIFINAACATSSLRNYEINPNLIKSHLLVDLENPLILLENILNKQKNRKDFKLNYILINTIVSKIQSPDNSIYYSFKILQQEYIKALELKNKGKLKFTNVIIGTQINRNKVTKKAIKLADRIKSAILKNKSEIIFGFEGRLVYYLYIISPIISNLLIYIKRMISK